MNFPADLKYSAEHEWVRIEGSVATCGITEFAQSELGDVVFVDLAAKGKKVKQKEALCVVESTKAASDVYAPIGGTVKESNSALSTNPELVNKDPYGAGWMIKLEGVNTSDLTALMDSEAYKKFLGDKINH